MRWLMILVLRVYQLLLSPLFGRTCRFHPTCSEYAILCLRSHGFFRGTYLAVRRVVRCHPYNEGGHDPVPEPAGSKGSRPEN